MPTPAQENTIERRLYQLFEVSILLKGLNAIVEIVLGTLLIFVDVNAILQSLIENELLDDPRDLLANYLQPLVHISPGAQSFAALYLLSHGAVKVVLVGGLLRNKMWAYPASLVVFGIFILYQVVRFFRTHSIALVALTIFDLVVMWLIFHEYRRLRGAAV